MTTITSKEIDESTNKVMTFVGREADGRSLFLDLADTAAMNMQVQLRLGVKIPKDLATGRIKITRNVVVPKLNATTGIIEYGTVGYTAYVPASWVLNDRKRLEVFDRYIVLQNGHRDQIWNLDQVD